MRLHYAPEYFHAPSHQITVDLVGMGGTGSMMLSGLARMNHALISLGHPGLHLRCWDADTVTDSNIGRQLFSPADLHGNKAVILVTRINAFFGFDWEARAEQYTGTKDKSNITITCVDTAAARVAIGEQMIPGTQQIYEAPFYWLDLGNLQKTGQVVLGTVGKIKQQEKSAAEILPNVVKLFPQLKKIKEVDLGPSCSLAEALRKQDLYINSTLAQLGCGLLWKLFREGKTKTQGCYVNIDSLIVNPIKIK